MKAIVVAAASLFALTALSGLAVGHDLPYTVAGRAGPYAQGTGERGGGSTDHPGGAFDCGLGNHPVLNLSLGGVCFGAGAQWGYVNGNHDKLDGLGNPAGSTEAQHITAGSQAMLRIADGESPLIPGIPGIRLNTPGVYCQDLNEDWLCGGAWDGEPQGGQCELPPGWNFGQPAVGGLPEGTSMCPLRSEPFVEFCDEIEITSGLDGPLSGDARRRTGVQWDPQAGTWWVESNPPIWKVSSPVFIFIPYAAQGNSAFHYPACSGDMNQKWAWGTTGTVSHS